MRAIIDWSAQPNIRARTESLRKNTIRRTKDRMVMRQELENLKKNIAFSDARLEEMSTRWRQLNGSCCPGCMFGQKWHDVEDRLNRQIDRAMQIAEKLYRDSGQLGPLPRLYGYISSNYGSWPTYPVTTPPQPGTWQEED